MLCKACPRQCNAERNESVNKGGFCEMPLYPVVARAALHFGEEPCISGKNGSGTIFFSGCSLKCVYCQNEIISHKNKGKIISPKRLAEIFKELENSGAHNINFVNPTHFIYAIKEALSIYKPRIPLVYNSSGYDLPEKIGEDIFDIYLMDLKYINEEKSLRYSGVNNYFEYASKSIKEAYRLKGETVFDDNGLMKSGVIVRHLILPMNTNESKKIVDWFSGNTNNAVLSLMSQYTPMAKAEEFSEINRKITKREYDKVIDYAIMKNIKKVYVQEMSSADKSYIPNFDLYGV